MENSTRIDSPSSSGVCAIKAEFLLEKGAFSGEETLSKVKRKNDGEATELMREETKKKIFLRSEQEGSKGKNIRGQNKARPKPYYPDKVNNLCRTLVDVKISEVLPTCSLKNCTYIHDPTEYLLSKPSDLGPECHVFNTKGYCRRGLSCRFATKHITSEGRNLVDQEKLRNCQEEVLNLDTNTVQRQLEKRKYDLTKSERVRNEIETLVKGIQQSIIQTKQDGGISDNVKEKNIGSVTDEDVVKLLTRETKTIDWHNKLYLSPLTTVGNLPFRRICKQYGADITCGEMALCESLLKGNKQEWALLKRHSSEDIFGVQICGSNPSLVSKVAQVIDEHIIVDFVDLNLGCPIDFVYQKGGGCGMMLRARALECTVRSASALLSVPFSVKMRTGVYHDKNIAHTLLPGIVKYGAAFFTLHGRSREERYSRLADWKYIERCAQAAAPCPLYGNGDILSYEDYVQKKNIAPSTSGVMIGRGALIKPWIFEEIKEQKLWDIHSSERFEILKKYTNYGLEHWGSDTVGVENTRRFLLEWLSFLCRYVPVGILERPPQIINQRPHTFFGRDDLETLMASGNCADWIKISEMLLGPIPSGFKFLPKHKASAYK